MKSICVFCGSSPGLRSEYREAAIRLGKEIAKRQLHLVYGGANLGLMAAVANTVLDKGGQVTGVIPQALVKKEVVHTGLEGWAHLFGNRRNGVVEPCSTSTATRDPKLTSMQTWRETTAC